MSTVLDRRRVKVNGKYPVKIEVVWNRKQKYFPTGVDMTEDQWNKASAGHKHTAELEAVEDAYRELTGQEMTKYYRPPQGKYSESNLQMAQELGYQTFFWSLAYVDWYQDDQPSREEAFDKLLGRIHPGAVVLLHSTSSTNAEILDELLAKWEEMGYSVRPLSELAEEKGKTRL